MRPGIIEIGPRGKARPLLQIHRDADREMTQIQDPPSKNRDNPLQDLLTFERALTQPVTILIYWAGLAMIGMIGFAAVGVAVGVALRGAGFEVLLALPAFVFGALLVFVLALLWRGATEFYVAVFKIADELKAVRERCNGRSGR
eukprot:gene15403-15544_t